jgi:hypothetical protein
MACNDPLRTLMIQVRSIITELTTPTVDLAKINLLISVLKTSPFYVNPSITLTNENELIMLNNVIVRVSSLPIHLTCNTSNSAGPHIAIERFACIVSDLVKVSLYRELCSSGTSDAGRASVQNNTNNAWNKVVGDFTNVVDAANTAIGIISSLIDPPHTQSNSLLAAITSLFKPHPQPAC